jgi:hypothetical protein
LGPALKRQRSRGLVFGPLGMRCQTPVMLRWACSPCVSSWSAHLWASLSSSPRHFAGLGSIGSRRPIRFDCEAYNLSP